VGAGLAFEAALDRYRREDYILLTYHVHIPLPDPMTNPSTLERQKFYGVRSSPSFYIDGDAGGGGGSAEMAESIFETKVDPIIEKRLAVAAEAKIDLRATTTGSTVKVKTRVSKLTSTSDKLKLQVALVEESVRYSGENGVRFHGMVVRNLAVPPAVTRRAGAPAAAGRPASQPSPGFALKPRRGGTFEYTFDLAKVAAEAKAHLEDFETNTRKGQYTFREKKHEMNASDLAIVAFVQDEATKKILQAVYVKPPAGKTPSGNHSRSDSPPQQAFTTYSDLSAAIGSTPSARRAGR
jgi:hypothetical protein